MNYYMCIISFVYNSICESGLIYVNILDVTLQKSHLHSEKPFIQLEIEMTQYSTMIEIYNDEVA